MSDYYDSPVLHSNPFAAQPDEEEQRPFGPLPDEDSILGQSVLGSNNYNEALSHQDTTSSNIEPYINPEDHEGHEGHEEEESPHSHHNVYHNSNSNNDATESSLNDGADNGHENISGDGGHSSLRSASVSGSGPGSGNNNSTVRGSGGGGSTAGSNSTGSAPGSTAGSISGKRPIKKYKLVLKVTGLERHGKKDPIIRFDAYTTLPGFRTTTFRDIRRTHHEFIKFFEHLNGANAECFVPSIPPAVTSAGAGTEEDEIKVKAHIQTWLDRVSSNPILARDEEFIYFIEADFGYTPVIKRKPPATGLARKAMKQLQPPYDEVAELHELRPLIKRVYQLGLEANTKLEKVTKSRRNLGIALNDFGTKTALMSNLESHQGMINMWRKLGKTLTSIGDYEAVRATAEAASFGDGINWVASNAYVAKEALTNRHLLMRELIKAQANTKSKHQVAVRVKGSTNISPLKVDEAIAALTDATEVEEKLTNKIRRVSDNMLFEKKALLANIEQDILSYIGEYALRIIECERRSLAAWESIRLDIRAVDANGGLSRLGRESTPANRRTAIAQSQGIKGDSWSGDRQGRAADLSAAADKLLYRDRTSITGGRAAGTDGSGSGDDAIIGGSNTGDKHHGDDDEEDEDGLQDDEEGSAVDARNAASLLAGSTF